VLPKIAVGHFDHPLPTDSVKAQQLVEKVVVGAIGSPKQGENV
jgi:hypothetical protein